MFCRKCGNEIQEDYAFCPKCGEPQQEETTKATNTVDYSNYANVSSVQKTPYNTACIIGFTLSVISLIINFVGLIGIAGTVISAAGLTNCLRNNEKGKNLI